MIIAQPSLLLQPSFASLEAAKTAALACTNCGLCHTRNQVVFNDGNPAAKIMIIGEAPGAHEDEQGIPFVGRAGQLLTQIIESVGFNRQQDTYICNMVKCRPPENRVPTPIEVATCRPYLMAQIQFVQPAILLLAGSTALKGVLGIKTPISKIRGQWLDTPFNGTRAMAIFHPSYLLRNQRNAEGSPKALMALDMQIIRQAFENL